MKHMKYKHTSYISHIHSMYVIYFMHVTHTLYICQVLHICRAHILNTRHTQIIHTLHIIALFMSYTCT